MKQNLKKYSVKNYKGNLLESLGNFLNKYKDVRVVKIVEDNGNLSIFAEDIGDNKFKVGCKYTWWSKNVMYTEKDFVVVDIAPDRSYILIVPTTAEDPAARKFKVIDDGNGGEKISDHPAAYTWRVARADKGGEYVGVPDGWYDAAKARRQAGANAAVETRNIKSFLNNIRKKLTKEHFYKFKAAIFKDKFDSWEAVQKYWQENGWDKELNIYEPASKIRLGKKIMYAIHFGPKDASPIAIGYDGQNFYELHGTPDKEIREILSDIL